ncbi:MAG: PKD domain-containing protein [Bacteroidia bacterium]
MKNIYQHFLFLLLWVFGGLTPLLASHIMGTDMSYQCIGPCNYRIYTNIYYDCEGAFMVGLVPAPNISPSNPLGTTGGVMTPAPPAVSAANFGLVGVPTGCNVPGLTFGNATNLYYYEVPVICPTQQTGCVGTNQPINGVVGATYYWDLNLCNTTCQQVQISWDNCCMNQTINSVLNPSSVGMGTNTTTIDLTLGACNNSPIFQFEPVPYICAGQAYTFSQGAFDPDGDSLSYSLGPCLNDAFATVPYNTAGGYSAAAPLGSTWSAYVDPGTGEVTFTPTPTGNQLVAIMCIYVQEWRNGVQIGEVVREMQITVISCNVVQPIVDIIQNNTLSGISVPPLGPYTTFACVGSQVCFDIGITNPQAGINYTMWWNQSLVGGSFVSTANPAQIDSVISANPQGHFCWTPSFPGVYNFVISVKGDNCPVPGFTQKTFTVVVDPGISINAQVDYIDCNEVLFSGLPPSTSPGPFVYSWSGLGNLSGNPNGGDSSLTHLYPGVGYYPWILTITDGYGCKGTTNGLANIQNGAIADAGSDVTMCSGFQFQLGIPPITGQTYSWYPATGLIGANSTTIANPNFTMLNPGPAPDTFDLTLQVVNGGCITYDYTTVIVAPNPAVDIIPASPDVCEGESVVLTATGGTSYLWNTGDTTATITVTPSSTASYSVISFLDGCSSVPSYETIIVKPGPIGQITGNPNVCGGQSTNLIASSSPTGTYVWDDLSTNPIRNFTNVTGPINAYMIPTANGCKGDTVFAQVSAFPSPVPSFTFNTVCQGLPTLLTNTSTVAGGAIIGTNWNFADANSGFQNNSNLPSPSHVFTSNGTFPVQLVVTSNNGCIDSITTQVTVSAVPNASFTATDVCFGGTNQFVSTSTIAQGNNLTSQAWNFGNSQQGSGQTTSHNYANYGDYVVTLTATSDNGCVDSAKKTIFVHPNPVSNFTFDVNCWQIGTPFIATPTVPAYQQYNQVTSYAWDFGDMISGNNTSVQANPFHLFSTAGTFNVNLQVTTNKGCTHNTIIPVLVLPQPAANFTIDKTCANELLQLTSISTADPSTPLVQWEWFFGNTGGAFTVGPQPTYNLALLGPGTYPTTLVVTTDEGCKDTILHDIVINPVPSPKFSAKPVCLNDPTTLVNESQISTGSVIFYNWQPIPGINISDSTNASQTYTFPTDGQHLVTLTAISDSGCVTSTTKPITIHPLPVPASLQGDTTCFGSPAILEVFTQENEIVNWYLNAGDTVPFHKGDSYVTPPLYYGQTFYIDLITKYGCRNGVKYEIDAENYPPADLNIVVDNKEVLMPNNSVSFATASTIGLTAYSWTFGDGNESLLPRPVHEYGTDGRYTVELRAIDENGCELIATQPIEVKKVVSLIVPSAFTPNGDGTNDDFYVGYYNLAAFRIAIYDRWGVVVFESNSPDFKWNGKDKKGKDVPEGTYVWVVEGVAFDGNKEKQSGTVTVLR